MSARLLVVGEVVVDLLPDDALGRDAALTVRAYPGGSPANVALAAAALGMPTRLAARVSRHGFGPWLRAHLVASGVDVGACIEADEPCALAVVTTDAAGTPAYAFHLDGAADFAWRAHELPAVDGLDVSAVHSGSLAVAMEPGRRAVAAWLARVHDRGDVLVSIDPNVREHAVRADVDALVRHAHVVKLSDDDVRVLQPGARALDVAVRWLASGPELVVVTHGAAGATALLRDGRSIMRPAPQVAVVDTVGAGDAFTAGLLHALDRHDALRPGAPAGLAEADVAAVLDAANGVAALSCARRGAGPPAPGAPARSPRAC